MIPEFESSGLSASVASMWQKVNEPELSFVLETKLVKSACNVLER